MTISIVQPKRPTVRFGWRLVGQNLVPGGYPSEAWVYDKNELSVLTAVELADGILVRAAIPQYHLSVSKYDKRRCTSAEALWVLAQFDLADAKEDNHVPNSVVHNYWRPVADRYSGAECLCTADEVLVREDKGDYVWRPLP